MSSPVQTRGWPDLSVKWTSAASLSWRLGLFLAGQRHGKAEIGPEQRGHSLNVEAVEAVMNRMRYQRRQYAYSKGMGQPGTRRRPRGQGTAHRGNGHAEGRDEEEQGAAQADNPGLAQQGQGVG